MEQQDLNKRLLLALALSFLVFVGYSYLFPVQKNTKQNVKTEIVKDTENRHQTPTVENTAMTTKIADTNKAPLTLNSKSILRVNANHFILNIDEFGRISQVELLEKKYHNEEGNNLKLFKEEEVKPLEIRFSDTTLNEEAFKTPYVNGGSQVITLNNANQTVILTQTLSTAVITKKITFKPSGAYDITITSTASTPYFITPGHRPMADTSVYMLVRGALIKSTDNIIKSIEDGDATGNEKFPSVSIASAFDRYVASLFYNFETPLSVSIIKEKEENPLIFVRGDKTLVLHGYIGAKDAKVLESIHPELIDAIEFGWFSFLSKPFFKVLLWIHDHIGNWGWSIILFTLLVKGLLFPLSYKGMMSMQKMKDLAPKMKELKAKYKDDPAKMNAQMMEMYRKHGANPMGGCLPLLMQIPIFFALYRVLLNAVELQGAPWILWIEDLAMMDPYFVLPLLMGASMWFQQRITPSNFSDPLQEKIFKFFPIIMTIFFVYFPAGLVLYWLVNNLFTIGQQYFINHMYAKHKLEAAASHKK